MIHKLSFIVDCVLALIWLALLITLIALDKNAVTMIVISIIMLGLCLVNIITHLKDKKTTKGNY